MIMAAMGAMSAVASITMGLGRSSPRPPKKKPNWAMVAMAPAMVALTVIDEGVAVLDVGELVRHHAREFVVGEHLHDAGGGGDRRVLRVAARREGVGLRIVDEIDLGHRQAGALRQVPHHAEQVRSRALVHLDRVVGGEREPSVEFQ